MFIHLEYFVINNSDNNFTIHQQNTQVQNIIQFVHYIVLKTKNTS